MRNLLIIFKVINDPKLTLAQKMIKLQKGVDDATRRKIYYALLQGQLLEKCFLQLKKVYKETLKEIKITRQWTIILGKLHKLIFNYSELKFCTVPLSYICSNFKIIKEICKRDKERFQFRTDRNDEFIKHQKSYMIL